MPTPASRAAALALCLLASLGPARADDFTCAQRTDLAGACFDASGALALHDGTPSARIALAGGRVLGVQPMWDHDDETFAAPGEVRRSVDFDRPLDGRFRVCPLTERKPGRMQSVCIEVLLKPTASAAR